VKDYIKALLEIKGENADAAADLMVLLYRMLSYACGYYIFSTEMPFNSVGQTQLGFLDLVLSKVFYNGITKQALKKAIALVVESNVDRDTLNVSLLFMLIRKLKSPDAKELATQMCEEYRKSSLGTFFIGDKRFIERNEGYRHDRIVENLAELYFYLKMELHETDDAIKYYKEHVEHEMWINSSPTDRQWVYRSEVALYCLLRNLERSGDTEKIWVSEYEKALKRKVKPRKELEKFYDLLKSGMSYEQANDAV
jgi:hypothetical protein